jgi:hypothetical protein
MLGEVRPSIPRGGRSARVRMVAWCEVRGRAQQEPCMR